MPRLRLTDLAIKALAPIEGRAVTYWDDLSPLGMRVAPGGTKTFIVLVGSGKRRKLGRYPHLTLLKARERAKNHLAELSSGASPLRIEDALDRYIENHCRKNTKASSAAEMERLLRKHILPKFRRKYLADIGPTDVAELIDDLLRTPGTANGVFRAMRAFFNWTVRRNYLTRSPCYGMQLPSRPAARERVLTDEELKAIWKVAIQYGWPFGTIVRLLLLTGQRRHEVASLRRSWIGDQCITLPASVTKNGRTHTFPFGDLTKSLLEEAPTTGDLLFPARGNSNAPFSGWSKSKLTFDKFCDIASWTLHDLRRTYATNLAALGTPVQVTEKLLNHVSGTQAGIVGVYQRHHFWDEQVAAIQAWEAKLAKLLKEHAARTGSP